MDEVSLPCSSCCWGPVSDGDLGRCRSASKWGFIWCVSLTWCRKVKEHWKDGPKLQLQKSLLGRAQGGFMLRQIPQKLSLKCPSYSVLAPGLMNIRASLTGQVGIAECHPGHVQAVPAFGCWALWSTEEGLRFCLEVWVAANWDDGSHSSVASSAQDLCIVPDLCIGPDWYVSCTQKLSIRAAGLLIDLVGCPARHLGLS